MVDIYNEVKAKVNRKRFLDWYFDIDYNAMGDTIRDMYDTLLRKKRFSITIDEIWDGVGYVPSDCVHNWDELVPFLMQSEIEDEEITETVFEVEWV